jgi:hypothetical protein
MATDDSSPIHHTQKMQKRLSEISAHLRQDIEKVDEPQMKVMFETAAEVLDGLVKAFQHYEDKNKGTWRKAG